MVGELALGHLKQRREVLRLLANLPSASVVTPVEVLAFVDGHQLMGRGLGYVDAHLLASAQPTVDARLWTRDKRLATVATALGLAVDGAVLAG